MHILEGEGVTKYFGGLAAVSEVNFHVDEGEVVGLIGPNGAGKTTLFNLISAALVPKPGIIKFADDDTASYGGISSIWDFNPKKDMAIDKTAKRDVDVDVILLSEFIVQNNIKVDFVFLDIEGCETLVFEDLLNFFEDENLPIFYFESHAGLYGKEVFANISQQFNNRNYVKSEVTPNHFLMVPQHLAM